MGCNSSKKQEEARNNKNSNSGSRNNKKKGQSTNPEQTNRNVWEDVKPLEAPYPQGQTDLNQVIDPNELQVDSIRMPNDEVVPDEKIGNWVTVKK